MKSVTSVSGGKTSAMMAIKFPTDYYVFAVVLTDHKKSAPKDKGLLRECVDRIPHFVATHEADLTLVNILKLEQEIGKEIKWVSSEFTLDDFITGSTDLPGWRTDKVMLPNERTRFCTEQCKIIPIFYHCYLNYWDGHPMLMNIGFRWDEPRRVESWTCEHEKIKYYSHCDLKNKSYRKVSMEWRISQFPMYENRITSKDVREFWNKKGWVFPEISNCRFCFHHRDIQSQRQAKIEPDNLQWWLDMEEKTGRTFGKRSLKDILDQPILDVFDIKPCHCTD